jgi:glycosyltransferase involved in cell wall biosynthesis
VKPIRILYLIDELYSSRAGSEQNLIWLLKNIPDSEFEKHFIIFSTFRYPETFNFGRDVMVLGERFGHGYFSWFRRLFFLLRYIRKNKIDLIQAFSPNGEFASVMASFLGRCGIVIGNLRDCGYDRNSWYRWIFWFSRLLRTRYIANSEAARRAAFDNYKIPLDSIKVIRNPIALERIQTGLSEPILREELFSEERRLSSVDSQVTNDFGDGKIVGMVATVRPIKDHPTLIRAAKIVLNKYPKTWFLFVGEQDADYKDELVRLAKREGTASRIIWYGGINNPVRMLPLFDVAVLSSHSESFSNAVLEYAVAERAIIVSDVGGLGEIIQDKKSGFLVPPENPEILAERIIQFLENPELAKNFGKSANEFAKKNYDEQIILQQYIEYYKNAVS